MEAVQIQVPTRRLNDYIRDNELPPPTVVKCDVEGAEGAVIRGLRPWLEDRTIRRLDIEFHPALLAAQGESEEELTALIRGFGYEARPFSVRSTTSNISFTRNPA
jgi:hypothetical protein